MEQIGEHPPRCCHNIADHISILGLALCQRCERTFTCLQELVKVAHHRLDNLQLHLLEHLSVTCSIRSSQINRNGTLNISFVNL